MRVVCLLQLLPNERGDMWINSYIIMIRSPRVGRYSMKIIKYRR